MKQVIILAIAIASGTLLADTGSLPVYGSESELEEYERQSMEDARVEDMGQEQEEIIMEEEVIERDQVRSSPIGGASAPNENSEENDLYE